jgi:thioredoxin-like negative regulator of GroEL
MRTIPLIVTLALVSLGIGGGVGYWQLKSQSKDLDTSEYQSHPDDNLETFAQQKKVDALLRDFHPVDAEQIISLHADELTEKNATGRKWIALSIRTAIELRDKQKLLSLYSRFPKRFENNESAALVLAEHFLQANEQNNFNIIRDQWQLENTKEPERWLVLDSNLLEMRGRRSDAIDLLGSQIFLGSKDTNRLVRLAMLSLPESPADAWNFLSEALRKDPDNADLRMYRAKLLESENRPTLALSEYLAAVQKDSKNPFMRDQLVDFYVRNQQYSEALNILVEGFKYPTIDSAWVKAVFWEKVAGPSNIQWDKYQIPIGSAKPFISYMIKLPKDQFWDAKAFQKLPNYEHQLSTQPVSVWLRVFDLIKSGREDDAALLLSLNPFENLFLNPELETGIRRILNYRLNGSLVLKDATPDFLNNYSSQSHVISFDSLPFLSQLSIMAKEETADPHFTLPPDIQNLLESPLAFVSALLSQNWNQAALLLNTLQVFPDNIPDWVAVRMTRAIESNHGATSALQFARRQQQTPKLQLVMAELMIQNKLVNEAMTLLNRLKDQPGDTGSRASWMISLIYIDQKNYNLAKEAITNNPKLFAETQGMEGLARIALLEGDSQGAEKIYEAIQNFSAEARSFLARKAYADKNWNKARQLTISLIQEFPNNQVLRDNLNKINNEL